jgi:hypothetical protein
MHATTLRAGLLLTLAGSITFGGRAAGQVGPAPVVTSPRPPAAPGSFTGARPAVTPGSGLGGSSNIGGAPSGLGGGGIIGGPGMPGGVMGTQKSWHCPRCQREVGRGALPPAAQCCGPAFVSGSSPNGGIEDVPPPADPALPPTQPPPAGHVTASSEPAAPAGNGKLAAVGAGVVLTGLVILGVVVFLAVRARPGFKRPRRRRPASD